MIKQPLFVLAAALGAAVVSNATQAGECPADKISADATKPADHRVVELAFSLPPSYKFREGQTKWPLRRTLYKHVPRSLIDRPKRGFGVPIADWLRGPLREWTDDLLSPACLASDGLLNPDPIVRTWQQHRSGSHNWEYRLWIVLMFQAWRAHYF